MSTTCSECGIPAKLCCSRCAREPYCSQACQRKAWLGGHKKVCTSIKKIWKLLGDSKNLAIQYFGIEVFVKVVRKMQMLLRLYDPSDVKKYKPISLGSGSGCIEGFIRYLTGIDLTCVDPDPDGWQKKPFDDKIINSMFTPPKYKNIEHMVKSNPICKICPLLMINWPSPNQDVNFDLRTIEILQPDFIVLIVELFGGAGSTDLITMLSDIDGIYTPLEKELLRVLNKNQERTPMAREYIGKKYYLTELIKGYNGKELKLPSNFASMSDTQKSITAIAVTNVSFAYAIIILSKSPPQNGPTINVDSSKFTPSKTGHPIMNAYFEEMYKSVMKSDQTGPILLDVHEGGVSAHQKGPM